MTEQVEGQMAVSDEFAEWREEAAMAVVGEVAENSPAKDDLPDEVAEEERGLVTVESRPQQHLITGMAALARMSEDEFQQAMETIEAGQRRMAEFQKRAMTKGEDYGVVKGIDRPFLHLPGAEKMCLLYGFAARQEAERIEGRRAIQKVGDVETEGGEWLTPPLAYHVKTYVHLGSFDGPIVAMGYGEASSWETKYRYTWAKAVCPVCSREGMIRGKPDGKLKGKWWCPGREGGCNNTFEPADPRVTPPGKVENPDPWSLAETLLQMAAKRSFVAATRRATGTSGLFTQDEDSPSVQTQAEPEQEQATVEVSAAPAEVTVSRGGKPDAPTTEQIKHLRDVSKKRDLGPQGIADAIFAAGLCSLDWKLPEGNRAAQGRALLAFINENLTADQMGELLQILARDPAAEAEAPSKVTN